MKRAPIVLAGSAAGLIGVVSYQAVSTPSATTIGRSSAAPSTTRGAAATGATPTKAVEKATASTSTRTATGTDVDYQYGDLQLKVTLRGTRVTDISVVGLNVTDPRSEAIDQAAIPELRQEAMSAQSANIDGVSGASYTSAAYQQSLQSALDKLT